ncbi:Tetratricopeptide-like helical domain containing protein [Trema orientale]|uniref:Tetratricopeptide-like helical domain containing protein n=1 Tax=Trema orientale TaxID=63057 RepID=A0A2P5DA85_TREOI|nr:Tetratricopeptide-like helical domain containing protein [Trema orientale]
MNEQIWSSIERKCLYLLQRRNTTASLLQIHAFMLRNALETNVNLLTKFISASTSLPHAASQNSLGLLHHARRMFDKRPHRDDSFLCNCMIKAHADIQQFAESFTLYGDLRRNTGFVPDGYTFVILVKSCVLNLAIWEGQEIHGHAVKAGFCSNLYVLTALVDMYAKFGRMGCARMLFDGMNERNQVSCTALICGYARLGDMINAWKLFDEMCEKDSATYNAMIDGYAKLGDMGSAQNLFEGMMDRNVVTWTSMIYGYCRNGDLRSARSLFDAMPNKNVISWNAMISGYCQNKQPHEALKLFHEMQAKTLFEPDKVTIVSILPAIADLGAVDLGCWIHQFVQRKRLDRLTNVSTALIDMYAKCGEIMRAKKVFDEMPKKEIASWNALINGFAVNGRGEEALKLFSEMQHKKLKPNDLTLLGVLSACNHSGLVEEGKRWFKAMEGFELIPKTEHYGCMVDLLGRAGCLEEAEKLIEGMPYEANGIILSSFLSACGYFNDFTRAKKILSNAVKLEPGNDGNYVTMRNLYATGRRWSDSEEIKKLMKENGANKEVGFSFIEVDGTIRDFVSGNKLQPHWDCLELTLAQLWKHMRGDLSC